MSSQQSVLPMFAGKTASGSITVVMNVTQQDGTQTSTSMVVSVGSCAPSSSSDATNLVNNFYSMVLFFLIYFILFIYSFFFTVVFPPTRIQLESAHCRHHEHGQLLGGTCIHG